MKKLSRRLFLKDAGIISTMAISVNYAFSQKTNHATKFELNSVAFLNKIPSKQYRLEQLNDSELMEQFQLSLQKWKNTGYETIVNSYYVCQNNRLVLFPLEMSHFSLGLLDTAVLCFGKDKNDKWQQLRSISGFELEALQIATESLLTKKPTVDLAAYLLPSPKNNQNSHYLLHTEKGDVCIATKLSPTKTTTNIRIREHGEIIFQTEIVSQHLLIQKL
jgi:hypothetical protein